MEFIPSATRRLLWLCLSGLTALGSAPVTAQSFRTINIEGRAYAAVSDVAAHFNLRGDRNDSERFADFSAGGRSLIVSAERRDIVLQGINHWLDAPVRLSRGKLWIARDDITKTLDPVFKPRAAFGHSPLKVIVLDPGHGGRDHGARSVTGQTERWYTLDLAKRVERNLSGKGYRVFLTRTTDTTVSLEERVAFAGKNKANLLVSIHFNSGGTAHGIETFCLTPAGAASTSVAHTKVGGQHYGNKYDAQNVWLAHCVQRALIGQTGAHDRGVRRARFQVLRDSPCPAILVEAGFLSSPRESQKIATVTYRDLLAKAIAEGILQYAKALD